MDNPPVPNLRLGTSSWSSDDWVGVFYLPGTPPSDYLAEYARHFDTVEVDSTFYRTPSISMVKNWDARTPPGFLFAAKFPQVITHEKVMQGCRAEVKEFISRMEQLGDKLGPLLLQFPYFNKRAFRSADDFLAILEPFLDLLPRSCRYGVEVRNRNWVDKPFLDVLRKKRAALALIDHPWMMPVQQLMGKMDVVTTDFTYIRWLGDRKGIEAKTRHWDRIIVDRAGAMETWTAAIRQLLKRGVRILGYFNNHYAGFAPGSIDLFYKVWKQVESKGQGDSKAP